MVLITFQIFNVDRVLKGEAEIERQFPAFKGWTTQLLKARQAEELKSDCFGSGKTKSSSKEHKTLLVFSHKY